MKRLTNNYIKGMVCSFILAVMDALLLFGLNPAEPLATVLSVALYVLIAVYCVCSVLRVVRPLEDRAPRKLGAPAYHRP